MGKLFARVFRAANFKVLVSDLKTKKTPAEIAAECDILIISVPIEVTAEVIEKVAPHLKKSAILMDLTSVKKMPVEKMRTEFSGNVVGAHPLFGPVENWQNETVVLCAGRGRNSLRKISEIFRAAGLKTEILSAEKHDRIVSFSQVLPHFFAANFVEVCRAGKISASEFLKFAPPNATALFKIFQKIAAQNPKLTAPIQTENEFAAKTLREFLKSGKEFQTAAAEKKFSKLEKIFTNAKNFFRARKTNSAKIEFPAAKEFHGNFAGEKIAILGPVGTFSEIAANRIFPKNKKVLVGSIDEVFDILKSGKVNFGFVPFENKIDGAVIPTLDGLKNGAAKIYASFKIPIAHFLIAPKNAGEIQRIFSHPQALAQCKNFLRENFGAAKILPADSTAAAAENLTENSAAIVAEKLARNLKFKILAENCADEKDNLTVFGLIGNFPPPAKVRKNNRRTAIVFEVINRPGSLVAALQIFQKERINLVKIFSRPTGKNLNEFIFFVDLEAKLSDPKVARAFAQLEKLTIFLKVLGEF